MKHYVVAEVKVTDPSWIPDYAARVHELIERHGGRYLARAPVHRCLEGEPPDVSVVVILEFPSDEAITAFLADPEYRPFGEARQRGSLSHLYSLAGLDALGTIPYLPRS